jgi:opacity protein-like surface antigen
MKPLILLFTLLMAWIPLQHAKAEGWQIGGGGQYVEFGDDLDDVDSGFGAIFSAAYHQSRFLGFDFQVGLSGHEEDIEDGDVAYVYGMAGLKLLLAAGDVKPYLAAGISFHSVGFEEFDTISGEGLYYGIGLDIGVAPRHAINISYRVSDWDGEDDVFDYDIENGYLGVAYNFRFTPR